jgi:hypothetical protein
MSNVATVVLSQVVPNPSLPAANAAYKNSVITVTDGAGAVQTANVDGTTESPPWTAVFNNVANGNCTASAQDTDVNGLAIGPAVSTTFTMGGGTTGSTYPATAGITVTVS